MRENPVRNDVLSAKSPIATRVGDLHRISKDLEARIEVLGKALIPILASQELPPDCEKCPPEPTTCSLEGQLLDVSKTMGRCLDEVQDLLDRCRL